MGIILKAAWKLKMRYLCNAVLLMVQQISMFYSNLSICANPEYSTGFTDQRDCRDRLQVNGSIRKKKKKS